MKYTVNAINFSTADITEIRKQFNELPDAVKFAKAAGDHNCSCIIITGRDENGNKIFEEMW